MHPAPSVIIFTSLSGLGFGLLIFLGLGYPDIRGWMAFVFFAIAYALAVGGLLASTFHLGHPERAIKAFSQWRTSWLSREAWCSVAALSVMGLYALFAIFLGVRVAPLGWLGAALSLATVYTTSMIYGQLKTVPRWNMFWTPVKFLTFALAGGALLSGQVTVAIVLLMAAGFVQIAAWLIGDSQLRNSGTNMASATGLGHIGQVRAFEPPHTGTNYLLREFVHVVGSQAQPETPSDLVGSDGLPAGSAALAAFLARVGCACGTFPHCWSHRRALVVLRRSGTCGWTVLRQALILRPSARSARQRPRQPTARQRPRQPTRNTPFGRRFCRICNICAK